MYLLSRSNVRNNFNFLHSYLRKDLHFTCFRSVSTSKPIGYWDNEENVLQFLKNIEKAYNLNTLENWKSLTKTQIKSKGGSTLFNKYTLYELKCMGFPEGKNYFRQSPKPSGYWEDENNITEFLNLLKDKLDLNTTQKWNQLNKKQIISFGGSNLFKKYSLYELKCLGYPEGKSQFDPSPKPSGFWDEDKNVLNFLSELKEKYNLKSAEDWNKITWPHIQSIGGSNLFYKFSLFELKRLGFPEGKFTFDLPKNTKNEDQKIEEFISYVKEKLNLTTSNDWNSITIKQIKSIGGDLMLKKLSLDEIKSLGSPDTYYPSKSIKYWENEDNVIQFLEELREQLNLKTSEDWNSITTKIIKNFGGNNLLKKYSLFDLKLMGCPEGKSKLSLPNKPIGYWENEENVLNFINQIKEKFNFETEQDWNSLTYKLIKSNGGSTLLRNYSILELKKLGFPNGNFSKTIKKIGKFDDILDFLSYFKQKMNLKTFEDWDSITPKQIKSFGGKHFLNSFSLFDIKCLGFPESKSLFMSSIKPIGYWDNEDNVKFFLTTLGEKLNLVTADDWNSITVKDIKSNGGTTLLRLYSIYTLKCLGSNYSIHNDLNPRYPAGYWNKDENVLKLLMEIKEKLNFKTPGDWNKLSVQTLLLFGGTSTLLRTYSLYQLKCMAFPSGKDIFDSNKSSEYWEDHNNVQNFLDLLQNTYDLKSEEDWTRLSHQQVLAVGGRGLIKKISLKGIIQRKFPNAKVKKKSLNKRSSQRWLFLQVQKLFPGEEIIEDYYHSEISRHAGSAIQFDIFLINKSIAIEYNGKQHYEDIPKGFSPLELFKYRDQEKEKICNKFGIRLVIIPYWWDNKLESLRVTLNSKINFKI